MENNDNLENQISNKKKNHKWILVLRVIFVAIILVGAGVYYFLGGSESEKNIINTKKKLSSSYEQVYRKNVFPKLSKWLIPKWALEEQEAKKKAEEEKLLEEKKKALVLRNVPQAPEGLEYFPLYEENTVVYGRDGWLYSSDSNSIDYYLGKNVLSEDEMADYCSRLNRLGRICEKKGIELVMMVGPNKEQVFPEHYPSVELETKFKRLLVLEQYLHANCSVPFLYPVRELARHKDQYETYWKYDTHWNSTGAYVAMKEIYQALGRHVYDNTMYRYTEETWRGDLAYLAGYEESYLDYITVYRPDIGAEAEIFNWEWDIDYEGITYTSTAKTNKNLVIVGDSYRVELGRHMCKDYKKSNVFHRELLYYDEIAKQALKNLKSGDTLVLISVERWDYKEFDAINEIISIMQ